MEQRAYLQCVSNRKVYLYDMIHVGYPAINAGLYFLLCVVLLILSGIGSFFIDSVNMTTSVLLFLSAFSVAGILDKVSMQVLIGEDLDRQNDISAISADAALLTVQHSKQVIYRQVRPWVIFHALCQLGLFASVAMSSADPKLSMPLAMLLAGVQAFAAYGVYTEMSVIRRIATGRNTVCWRDDPTPHFIGFKRQGETL